LESDTNPDPHQIIEAIHTLNRENYKDLLKTHDISVIEVYAKKCPGCRTVEPILPQIGRLLASRKK
jgi:hypothetical protein